MRCKQLIFRDVWAEARELMDDDKKGEEIEIKLLVRV